MAKNPAINHGVMLKGNVHFTIVKEGRTTPSGNVSRKVIDTNLYIYYKDKESLPCKIENDGQIFDNEWLHWKAKSFVKTVDESILDGNG